MLNRSDAFIAYAGISGQQCDTIVAITTVDAATYYFALRPMPRGLNSAPIYPMLLEHGNIVNSIDIFTKQSTVADVPISLSNVPFYPQAGGSPIRVAALLENLNGSTCKIYQWAEGIDDITDCLCIFDGFVGQSLHVRGATANFTAKDRSKLWDIRIPTRQIRDEWPTASPETANYVIPLLYGDFSHGDPYLDEDEATGLAKAILIMAASGKLVIADHPVVDIDTGYRDTGGPSVVPAYTTNSDIDDGGIAWVLPTNQVRLDFLPDPILPAVFTDERYYEPTGHRQNLADQVEPIGTLCQFRDRLLDEGGLNGHVRGRALWGIQNSPILREHLLNAGYIKAGYQWITVSGASFSQGEVQQLSFYLYFGHSGTIDERVECGRADKVASAGASIFTWASSVWYFPGDATYQPTSSEVYTETPADIWALGVEFWGFKPAADGILNNQILASMSNAKLRYYHTVTQQLFAWAEAAGKPYGTVLGGLGTGTTRSNPHYKNAAIEDTAFIIEDLYRTHLGLTSADIDIDSFDAAATTSIKARIQITESTMLSTVVEKLLEQSTLIIHASGAGKLRCIPLDDPTPIIQATITRDQLVNDELSLEKTRYLVNVMTVNSQWQPEYGRYKNTTIYEDAVSRTETLKQDRTATFSWENIMGSSAIYVATHYVNSTDGLWSKEHNVVSFITPSFMYSHLQIGDWIELDSNIDDLCPAFGTSWAGKSLLITHVEHTLIGTAFTAIERW